MPTVQWIHVFVIARIEYSAAENCTEEDPERCDSKPWVELRVNNGLYVLLLVPQREALFALLLSVINIRRLMWESCNMNSLRYASTVCRTLGPVNAQRPAMVQKVTIGHQWTVIDRSAAAKYEVC